MSKCLIAEYETNAAAKISLELLEQDGFALSNVSVVANASDPAAVHLNEIREGTDLDAEPSVVSGSNATSLGMLIGGTIAAPIAAGTLIGPLIIAGPLVGMAFGAAIGSILGGMEQWGVHHHASADYEQRVKAGATLLIVHDVEAGQIDRADTLLKTTNPKTLERYEGAS